MSPQDDEDLLLAYLADGLSAGERAAVEARLKAEPALARSLLRLSREETALGDWARAGRTAGAIRRAAGLPPAGIGSRRVRYLVAAAALAAGAAVVFVLLGPFSPFRAGPPPTSAPETNAGGHTGKPEPPPVPSAVARVEAVRGDVQVRQGDTERAAVEGGTLAAGSEVVARGEDAAAVLRYDDGTRLDVGAATRLRLESGAGKRVVLLEGVLAAEVSKAPDGPPLLLRTPHAEVSGQGTRFISTSTDAATCLELEEGQVDVRRVGPGGAAGEAVRVQPGSYVVVSPQSPHIAPERLPARRTDSRVKLPGSGGPVLAVAFAAGGRLVCLNFDGTGSVWDLADGTETRRLALPDVSFTALAVSPDGTRAVLAGTDRKAKAGCVTLWDVAAGRDLGVWRGPREALAVAFSPDGKTLAVGGTPSAKNREVGLYTLTGDEVTPWPAQADPVHALAFSPDGKTLAVGGKDGGVRLYDTGTGSVRATLPTSASAVQALAYSADGARLAGGSRDGSVRVWVTATGRQEMLGFNPRGAVMAVTFTPDSRLLLTAGKPGLATLWDPASGRELTSFQGHGYGVCGVAVTGDGRTLATAGWDRSVRLWDLLPRPRWWRPAQEANP